MGKNSPLSESYESLWSTELAIRISDTVLAMDLGYWINDDLMGLFFFVIGLKVRRELSMGELTLQLRRQRLPPHRDTPLREQTAHRGALAYQRAALHDPAAGLFHAQLGWDATADPLRHIFLSA